MEKAKICCPKKTARGTIQKDPVHDLAMLAKALGHPIRLQILAMLKSKKTCICGEIVDELPLAQATVSQHLKVLKNAGFIRGTISGPKTCYCLETSTLTHFKQRVRAI